ncbi:MAG: hydrolase TatD [Deltaproteobacteria bacterium]|nr:MAG: hydrolase TatD [Deltaproteobacteria bacterium]
MYIDTHCHLDMSDYHDDFGEVLARAADARVGHMVSIGVDLASSRRAVHLARTYPQVSAVVGVHPHEVGSITDKTYAELKGILTRDAEYIVGYGEIGLDYCKNYAPANLQQRHFGRQLELAKEFNLPVVIHDRDAHREVLTILKEHGPFKAGGILHCFSGDYDFARQVLELGFYISIPGIVTFKNAADLQEVAKKIPLESMLLETDGPFLTPVPFRGKRNEPAYIPLIAAKVAGLRQMSGEEVGRITTANAKKIFRLP